MSSMQQCMHGGKKKNEDLKLFWHAWGIGYWIRYFILRRVTYSANKDIEEQEVIWQQEI